MLSSTHALINEFEKPENLPAVKNRNMWGKEEHLII